jgi:hypothetical protein
LPTHTARWCQSAAWLSASRIHPVTSAERAKRSTAGVSWHPDRAWACCAIAGRQQRDCCNYNLMGDRSVWDAAASALWDTCEALVAAWLIDRHFGFGFILDRLHNVLIGSIRRVCLDHVVVVGERHLRHVLASYQNTTTRSERTYRRRRTRRFGVMCAGLRAWARRRSWAGYTINMFDFEFPAGTTAASGERSLVSVIIISELL